MALRCQALPEASGSATGGRSPDVSEHKKTVLRKSERQRTRRSAFSLTALQCPLVSGSVSTDLMDFGRLAGGSKQTQFFRDELPPFMISAALVVPLRLRAKFFWFPNTLKSCFSDAGSICRVAVLKTVGIPGSDFRLASSRPVDPFGLGKKGKCSYRLALCIVYGQVQVGRFAWFFALYDPTGNASH